MAASLTFSDMQHAASPIVTSLALAMGRPMGVTFILPVFTRAQLGRTVMGALALAIALIAAPGIGAAMRTVPVSPAMLTLLGVKEVAIGILIGLLFGLPVWSVEAAGELLDTQRSATQDRQSEPGTADQNSDTSSLLSMTAITLFVVVGGLPVLTRTIYDSYAIWPALAFMPISASHWAPFLLGLLDRITRTSLGLAAPVVLAMLLCEACVVLLMRAVPKLHVYDLAPTLRNLMFAMMLFAYASYLVFFMRRSIDEIAGASAALRTLVQ